MRGRYTRLHGTAGVYGIPDLVPVIYEMHWDAMVIGRTPRCQLRLAYQSAGIGLPLADPPMHGLPLLPGPGAATPNPPPTAHGQR